VRARLPARTLLVAVWHDLRVREEGADLVRRIKALPPVAGTN
jgi:hypothetical protein